MNEENNENVTIVKTTDQIVPILEESIKRNDEILSRIEQQYKKRINEIISERKKETKAIKKQLTRDRSMLWKLTKAKPNVKKTKKEQTNKIHDYNEE